MKHKDQYEFHQFHPQKKKRLTALTNKHFVSNNTTPYYKLSHEHKFQATKNGNTAAWRNQKLLFKKYHSMLKKLRKCFKKPFQINQKIILIEKDWNIQLHWKLKSCPEKKANTARCQQFTSTNTKPFLQFSPKSPIITNIQHKAMLLHLIL